MPQRNERIAELVLQELAILLRSVKDPGISGLLTLTGAELSSDRKTARVYYSVYGSDEDKQASGKALDRASDYLRFQLKSRIDLRFIPQLEFHYDSTAERAERIEQILGKIEKERNPHPR